MIARRWIAALAYVTFIYSTLGWAPWPLAYLRSHNVLRLSLRFLFCVFIGALFLRLLASRTRAFWRYGAAAAAVGAYYFFASRVPIPEERVHFLEYGLVGVFFARALQSQVGVGGRAAAGAFLLGTLAGVLDEFLQKFFPNRHYDPHDMILNAIAVALGLAVYHILPGKKAGSSTAETPRERP